MEAEKITTALEGAEAGGIFNILALRGGRLHLLCGWEGLANGAIDQHASVLFPVATRSICDVASGLLCACVGQTHRRARSAGLRRRVGLSARWIW